MGSMTDELWLKPAGARDFSLSRPDWWGESNLLYNGYWG